MKNDLHNNEIDGLFRDHLAGEEAAPREMVWKNIEKQLDAIPKKPGNWIWWLSSIVIVAGIGTWIAISVFHGNDKNKLSQNSNVTGWNYNDPANSDFDKVSNTASDNKKSDSSVNIEGGKFVSGNNNSADLKTENGAAANLPSSNSSSNYTTSNTTGGNKTSLQSDSKSNSIYSDKSSFEKDHQPLKSGSPAYVFNQTDSPDLHSKAAGDKNEVNGYSHEGAMYKLPRKLSEYTMSGHSGNTSKETSSFGDDLPRYDYDAMRDNPRTWPDSSSEKIISDTTKDGSTGSSGNTNGGTLPVYYAAVHGAVDAQRVLQSSANDEEFSKTDVRLYDRNKLNALPQQTYSYGARFGWFLSKRISLTAGAYYSIYQSSTGEGTFKFNHNNIYNFTMHSATSSVNCSSENFERNDGVMQQYSDTIAIKINSQERYDYVNLQLGISFYALRTKRFGIYGNLLSNGAILSKQQMTLTVPQSGKTLSYSGSQLYGMNKFIMGAQAGIGMEWMFTGNFGIWAEPSFFFSGAMNKNNAVHLQAGGMRYLAGVAYHF